MNLKLGEPLLRNKQNISLKKTKWRFLVLFLVCYTVFSK